jgi:hypothetical protein
MIALHVLIHYANPNLPCYDIEAANFELIRQWRLTLTGLNVRCENLRQIYWDYEVWDEVLVKVYNPASLKQQAASPFPIEHTHTNGTLTIQRMPNVGMNKSTFVEFAPTLTRA